MPSTDDIPTGLITTIRVQRKDPSRVSIYIDGEFAFGLYADIAMQCGLRKDVVADRSSVESALRAESVRRAYNAALNLLSYRMRTVSEISQRLSDKGFDEETVSEILRRLVERGYLDDQTFAREFATSRARGRGFGIHRIRGDLRKKGVDREIVDDVIATLDPEVDWLALARQQAEKRWPRLGTTADPRRRQKKLFDFLIRRGFDFGTARQVVEEMGE
ncbi:MAG: hypothetical protein HKN37_00620 [Rhodothermales bacterium]|nr:hypothetical protein [Rhodothermales bacterium]